MTEQEIKEACKFVIEHGQRDFTEAENRKRQSWDVSQIHPSFW